MKSSNKALVLSFLRVLGGCLVTAVTTIVALQGYGPLDFTSGDWKAVGNSGIGAFLVTAGNYLRPGEKRFGVHAEVSAEADDFV